MRQMISRGWSFFDNFDGLVYVADIDTHEIVYTNKKTMETYGLQASDLVGRPCYSLLQNNAFPCTFCNNSELQEGQFIKWNYYNPLLDRYLLLHDTLIKKDGHRYRMEIAFDVSSQEENTRVNDWQQTMERLVNEAIAVAIQKPTPDETMSSLLESIGKILKGDRVYIFEKNEEGNMDNTYEWIAADSTPEKENLQNVPAKTFEIWNKGFQKDHMVVIKDVERIRDNDPMVYAYLKPQNVHSLVVVPFSLHIENEMYGTELDIDGFYGIDNPPSEYLEYTKTILRIVSHFILGILKRRNLVRELQHLSLLDHQTKLGNRHAMNQYITKLQDWEQLGVVYCDVTGLKAVNDTKGHQEGDRLIMRACESLKKEFCEYEIFRIGGDELLVVCPEIEEEVLRQQADHLRQNALENDVVLAVGTSWTSEKTENMENMMFRAEQDMYQDKQKYYQESGRDRRRR